MFLWHHYFLVGFFHLLAIVLYDVIYDNHEFSIMAKALSILCEAVFNLESADNSFKLRMQLMEYSGRLEVIAENLEKEHK